MRRNTVISIVAILFTWFALDDITTDNDTEFWQEWLIVGASATWFAFLALQYLLKRKRS